MRFPRDRTTLPRKNWVDELVDELENEGHSVWGLVIYRTTYSDDEAWSRFLHRLQRSTREMFEEYSGLDVLSKMAGTVMDDYQFDGMSSFAVRDHCKKWIADNYTQEQGKLPIDGARPYGKAPRYRFAIQVDEESLQSMLTHDFSLQSWVRLIDLEWSEERWRRGRNDYDPIEGITREDVGWAKIVWNNFTCDEYVSFYDYRYWPVCYRRPPAISR